MMPVCLEWTKECLGVFAFRITLVSPLLGFIKILLYIVACLGICFHCVYFTCWPGLEMCTIWDLQFLI